MTTAADHESFELKSSGVRLKVHRWSPADGSVRAQLLIVHGYAEHAERYRELAHVLAANGISTIAPDLRGHGHSDGARGHVDDFDEYSKDVESALATLEGDAPKFILGHSNGGLVALDFVERYGPRIAGLILSNPFLELEMKVPALKAAAGRLAAKIYPRLSVPSGIPPDVVSRDPEIVAAYDRDPLVFTTATVGYVIEQEKTAARVKGLQSVPMPLLFIRSDADPLVSPAANEALADRIQSPDKTVWLREGAKHEVLNEIDRTGLHQDLAEWILARS